MDAEASNLPESTEQDRQNGDERLVPSDLLEAIPEDQRDEFSRRIGEYFLEVSREEHYAGPLQPADQAERWDALVPGTAARNFDIYEKQQLKRMEAQDSILALTEEFARSAMQLEAKTQDDDVAIAMSAINASASDVRRGQWFGFGGAILFGLIAFYLISEGNSGWGIAVVVAEIAAFAWVFVSQQRSLTDQVSRYSSLRENYTAKSRYSDTES